MAKDNQGPGETVKLLEELKAIGYTDQDFRRIHHMEWATIAAHLQYCRKVKYFQRSSSNRLVQERLRKELRKRRGN